MKKIWRSVSNDNVSCRPNFKSRMSRRSEQPARSEKKKNTASPERERFQGKSSGAEDLMAHSGLSPGFNSVGSTDTAGMTLGLRCLFNSKMQHRRWCLILRYARDTPSPLPGGKRAGHKSKIFIFH